MAKATPMRRTLAKAGGGWPGEPVRHGLASKGVKTTRAKAGGGFPVDRRDEPKKPKVLKTFPSSSSSRMYEVRLAKDGITYCTCPGWRFQKGQKEDRACRHMKSMGLRGDTMLLRA